MARAPEPRVALTLGTAENLGLIGKPIDLVAKVLTAWGSLERQRCRTCGLRFRVVISDHYVQYPRVLDKTDLLIACDGCRARQRQQST